MSIGTLELRGITTNASFHLRRDLRDESNEISRRITNLTAELNGHPSSTRVEEIVNEISQLKTKLDESAQNVAVMTADAADMTEILKGAGRVLQDEGIRLGTLDRRVQRARTCRARFRSACSKLPPLKTVVVVAAGLGLWLASQ